MLDTFLTQLKLLPTVWQPFILAAGVLAVAIWKIVQREYRTRLENKDSDISAAKSQTELARAQIAVRDDQLRLVERERDALSKELAKVETPEAVAYTKAEAWPAEVKKMAAALGRGETLTIDLDPRPEERGEVLKLANALYLAANGVAQTDEREGRVLHVEGTATALDPDSPLGRWLHRPLPGGTTGKGGATPDSFTITRIDEDEGRASPTKPKN